MSMTMTTILGVDIGGTFTDFVLLHEGHIRIHKLPTTPADPSRALLAGVDALGAPETLIHGTTIATNALLERRGAVTALLTTAGFADVLVIGRGGRPALYRFDNEPVPPLVPDELRLEVPERIAADGTVIKPLHENTDDTDVLHALIERLNAAQVEAIALCLLHSYRNPAHEQRLLERLHAAQRDGTLRLCFLCASSDVLPEYREYERTSTTVVNAYVAPVLDRYLSAIERDLAHRPGPHGHPPALHIMASDGGSMTAAGARQLAARTTLSGPAGGVVGARTVARLSGIEHIITFDMGGTSTDVALCDGRVPQTTESAVGGMPVRFPAIDIHTVGAGGGSLARIDAGGNLRVGPQSAGASPGPACYGSGTLPTVTDANLVLGRLLADRFLGGDMRLDPERAHAAIAPLAQHLDMDVRTAALGIVRVANAAMERAIRTISVERGTDPRDYTLVAFGGAGPLHAAYLADLPGIRRVLVPRYPGVLSALGMLAADITRDYVRALPMSLHHLSPDVLRDHMAELAASAAADMRADVGDAAPADTRRLRAEFALDLRYVGQSHEITTPVMVWEEMHPQAPDLDATRQRFDQLHHQHSGHALPEHPVEVVALRLKAVQVQARPELAPPRDDAPVQEQPARVSTRVQAALAADTATLLDTAVYERETLARGDTIAAPAIVVQFDTTCIIPPGWRGVVDGADNLVLLADRG